MTDEQILAEAAAAGLIVTPDDIVNGEIDGEPAEQWLKSMTSD